MCSSDLRGRPRGCACARTSVRSLTSTHIRSPREYRASDSGNAGRVQRTHPVEQGPEVGRSRVRNVGSVLARSERSGDSKKERPEVAPILGWTAATFPAREAVFSAHSESVVKRDARAACGARKVVADAVPRRVWQHTSSGAAGGNAKESGANQRSAYEPSADSDGGQ